MSHHDHECEAVRDKCQSMLQVLIRLHCGPLIVRKPAVFVHLQAHRLSLEVKASDPLKEMLAFSNKDRWDT